MFVNVDAGSFLSENLERNTVNQFESKVNPDSISNTQVFTTLGSKKSSCVAFQF